jgi:hypothetical protein
MDRYVSENRPGAESSLFARNAFRTRSQTPVWERTCPQSSGFAYAGTKIFYIRKSGCFMFCKYAKPELCAQVRSQAGAWERESLRKIRMFCVLQIRKAGALRASAFPSRSLGTSIFDLLTIDNSGGYYETSF